MYGRDYGDKQLNFEASGALLDASLVMRDKETDSWWSIMTSDSIGGPLEGTQLVELPIGEKSTWKDWRAKHPDSRVLSVDGMEHIDRNAYEGYFQSEQTFRNLEITDTRLGPKAPIFSFRWKDKPYAVPHAKIEGGRILELPGKPRVSALLFREKKASLFASTRAYRVEGPRGPRDLRALLEQADQGKLEPLIGFDTFWYSWVSVNKDTDLLP